MVYMFYKHMFMLKYEKPTPLKEIDPKSIVFAIKRRNMSNELH